MLYRILADGVVVVHFAFILFVAVGAVLAWRWPALVRVHLPALAWGAGTVVIGFPCPLTPLEKGLRRLAGEEGYQGGFVDHYIEDVIYSDEYTVVLRAVAVATIVVGYLGLRGRRRQVDEPSAGADVGDGHRQRGKVGVVGLEGEDLGLVPRPVQHEEGDGRRPERFLVRPLVLGGQGDDEDVRVAPGDGVMGDDRAVERLGRHVVEDGRLRRLEEQHTHGHGGRG
jgi:hypothetical protein